MRSPSNSTRFRSRINGETRQGAFYRSLRADDLASPFAVANHGEGNVQAVVSVSGAPLTPEPAAEQGFKIERSYHTLDGEKVDPSKAKQNQRFVVVLKMTEPQPQFGRVIVADYLPAGFEIDNPRLVSSGETGTLAWIADAVEPVNTEFRDDRFTAAFDRKQEFVAGIHRRLCGARGFARTLRVAAGEGRGHVPARPVWAHRNGHDRDYRRNEPLAADFRECRRRCRRGGCSPAPPGSIRSGLRRLARISNIRTWSLTVRADSCVPMRPAKDAGGYRRPSRMLIRAS